MTNSILSAKYKLFVRFYGVEEYIDYALPLLLQIESIKHTECEFNYKKKLLDLDIWYSCLYDRETNIYWDPFAEKFLDFDRRSDFVIGHYLSQKQYDDKQILKFIQ